MYKMTKEQFWFKKKIIRFIINENSLKIDNIKIVMLEKCGVSKSRAKQVFQKKSDSDIDFLKKL